MGTPQFLQKLSVLSEFPSCPLLGIVELTCLFTVFWICACLHWIGNRLTQLEKGSDNERWIWKRQVPESKMQGKGVTSAMWNCGQDYSVWGQHKMSQAAWWPKKHLRRTQWISFGQSQVIHKWLFLFRFIKSAIWGSPLPWKVICVQVSHLPPRDRTRRTASWSFPLCGSCWQQLSHPPSPCLEWTCGKLMTASFAEEAKQINS